MNAAIEPWSLAAPADVLLARWMSPRAAPWALALELWPMAQAQRWRVLLVRSACDDWTALAEQVPPPMLLERLETLCQAPVTHQACEAEVIDALLAAAAGDTRALASVAMDTGQTAGAAAAQELSLLNLAEQTSPVVRLLDATLYDALQDGASDVHFEANARGAAIRYRLDGVMLAVREVEGAATAEQLVSRLKVMAELDIGERRLPQDGRFKLRANGREIDFRLSIMPTVFGEDAVVRVLDRARIEKAQGQLTLSALGFDEVTASTIRRLASQPHGMLLVTGPTGSGKTTTLYAAITETYRGHDKIVTIEDPVEYQLPGVVQIPVNDKKGLSFARGLRSVLRHDPDRVMVGEIRDAETAQIAVQAALTGHLVFSTVHANSAFDVLGRFMHMGMDMVNVVSALNAVVAQRLMRIVCPHCVEPFGPLQVADDDGPGWQPVRGRGCSHCRQTGYKGRRAVAELLLLDEDLRDLIGSRAPMGRIRQAARDRGMAFLRDAARAVVRDGQSSLEELDRVTLGD